MGIPRLREAGAIWFVQGVCKLRTFLSSKASKKVVRVVGVSSSFRERQLISLRILDATFPILSELLGLEVLAS